MQSMSALLAGIYTNLLINTGFLQLAKHLRNDHEVNNIAGHTNNFFSALKKCNGKLDCWIYEMLFIMKKKPSLNTQSDSIRAKLFVQNNYLDIFTYHITPLTYIHVLDHST